MILLVNSQMRGKLKQKFQFLILDLKESIPVMND